MSKKLILTAATILCIGLTPFAKDNGKSTKNTKGNGAQKENNSDSTFGKKWYRSEYALDNGSSANLGFTVSGMYSRPVKKEKLNASRSLRDFIPGYPVNWITTYDEVEIWSTCNGKAMKAVSPNDALSAEQKNILATSDMGADIVINVRYKYLNPVNDIVENNEMHVTMTLVPDVEAEYFGGSQKMKDYFNENVVVKISKTLSGKFQGAKVMFTINEEGEVVNVKISKSSGDSNTDQLMLDAINKMPKWKPAENSKGAKLKQLFEFSIGNDGC